MKKTIKILIAEDEANIALALEMLVRKAVKASSIVTVSDGRKALELLNDDHYSLVISDWNMPYLSGLELLTELRNNEDTKKIPFLMLTARLDLHDTMEGLNLDITDYIAKPYDNDDLVEKISKLLKGHL